MTNDLPMELGRDLDARIAELIFGERVFKTEGGNYWVIDADDNILSDKYPPGGLVFPFSTDLAAAWKLVKHMQGLGYRLVLIDTDSSHETWRAEFQASGRVGGLLGYGESSIPSHAITLAALNAVQRTRGEVV